MSNFYISTALDATRSLVYALDDNTSREIPTLFLGDSIPISFTFTDGLGGYANFNGETDLSIKVAIGDLTSSSVYVLQDNFTYSNNAYSSTLVIMTDALANAMSGLDTFNPSIEIQINRANGESYTIFQSTVTIKNQLITQFSTSAYPSDTSINIPLSTLDSYTTDAVATLAIDDIAKVTSVYNNSKVDGSTITLNIGEYYRIIGYSDTAGGIVKINYNDDTWWIPDNHFIKVVEPADNNSGGGGSTDPDTDGDGATDLNDYFSNDANYTQSLADLNGYSLDTHKVLATGDIVKILEDWTISGVTWTAGEYYITENVNTNDDSVRINTPDSNSLQWMNQRAVKWEVVNPQADLTDPPAPPVSEGTQYYIWGDDDTNGVGYYYPVYTETTGLTSYHSHTFAGTDYYMKDSDNNHAELALPSSNALPPASDNLEPSQYIQLVWGSNYENKSSAFSLNANKQGYSRLNGGSTATNTSRDIDITSGTWRYNYGGQLADIFSTSIHNGQGIIGDMAYAHTFDIYKYKVTSFATVNQTVNGQTANRKIGIEALGTWSSTSERQTVEDATLDIFAEYFNQSSTSIWRDSSSSDYGTIIYNQTKNVFYFFIGNETGFIYADVLSESTAFDIDDEIIVLFE
jgi:hypothetical protein